MKHEAREEFYKWYNDQARANTQFDMQRDLVEYCMQDCRILRGGCMKFRELMVGLFAVDPFTVSSTIPGTRVLVLIQY
jgi:hypothetical protein